MSIGEREDLPWGHGYDIRGGRFRSKVLTIGMGTRVDCIRDGAVFDDCELRIARTTRQSMDFEATFITSEVRPRSALTNKTMTQATFRNCRFFGRYNGCEFGKKLSNDVGHIDDCDFSQAKLHLTAFYETELDQLRLPDWPHIFLVSDDSSNWRDDLAPVQLPPVLETLRALPQSDLKSKRSVLAVLLPELGIDAESLWPLIQDKHTVWFPGKDQRPRAGAASAAASAGRNLQAADAAERRNERSRVFHLLHRAWLKGVIRAEGKVLDLIFDTSFLQGRVPNAPAEVRVRMKDAKALHVQDGKLRDIDSSVDRFMLMGVGSDGEDVVLKAHRKERGQVKLSFSTYAVLSSAGTPIAVAELAALVDRYLHPDGQ
jgi:hypothetical protein